MDEKTMLDMPKTIGGTDNPPVLTIHLHSWLTPLLGIIMLLVGLAAGYWARPLVDAARGGPVAVVTVAPQAAAPAATTAAQPEPTVDAAAIAESRQNMMDALIAQTRHFTGDPNAPITMIELSDYTCPYCGKFETETYPSILKEYIETGKVRFGYMHFAILGPMASVSAQAAECAAEQEKFWDYHKQIFLNQRSLSNEILQQIAVELGLDITQFSECFVSKKYAAAVEADTALARNLGAQSTPSFVINGQPLIGAQPFEFFKQVIEQQLAATAP